MTSVPLLACSLCARTGLVYMVEGEAYCPSCMYRKHPPHEYGGPERRDESVSTPFARRADDMTPGHRRAPRKPRKI